MPDDINAMKFSNTFYISKETVPVIVSPKVLSVSIVPKTKSAALAKSKLVLCNTSDRPLVIESTLSKIIRQRRNLKDFTCSIRPAAYVAFIPSLSSAISSSVASMTYNV